MISWCSTRANSALALTPELARRIADRHFGIGCDTVVLIAARQRQRRRQPALLQCRWRRSRILRQCHALCRAAVDGRARACAASAGEQGRLASSAATPAQGLVTVDMGAAPAGLERDSAGRGRRHQQIPVHAGRPHRHRQRGLDGQSPLRAVRAAMPKKRRWPSSVRASKPIPCSPNGSMSNSPRCWTATISACGCGSAAWASRWPAAPAPAPPRWRRSRRGLDRPQGRGGAGWRHAHAGMARKRRPCADDRPAASPFHRRNGSATDL